MGVPAVFAAHIAEVRMRGVRAGSRYESVKIAVFRSDPSQESTMTDDSRTPVRIATPDDIPSIFSVRTSVSENHLDLDQLAERGVTPESMAEMLAREDSRTWVVDGHEGIRGFSTADRESGSIFAVFVSPGAEGRGYGRALLEAAEAWLFAGGWSRISLQTAEEPGNRAHGFYRAAGWELAGPADHGDVRYEKSHTP
jgi:GNAT superfamily N-acetyltransferase